MLKQNVDDASFFLGDFLEGRTRDVDVSNATFRVLATPSFVREVLLARARIRHLHEDCGRAFDIPRSTQGSLVRTIQLLFSINKYKQLRLAQNAKPGKIFIGPCTARKIYLHLHYTVVFIKVEIQRLLVENPPEFCVRSSPAARSNQANADSAHPCVARSLRGNKETQIHSSAKSVTNLVKGTFAAVGPVELTVD